jgi:dolichol-phosphate mannosyltransferase
MNPQLESALAGVDIAVVVPAYQAERWIGDTLAGIPAFVRRVLVVVDGATDGTSREVDVAAARDARIVRIDHATNRGVGAAMRTGYEHALAAGAEIVAKMDADGQMDPHELARLVLPVALGRADYAKGNRFVHARAIRAMPAMRLLGNAALSLLSKLSTGYWNLLDPTNGYTAISRETLVAIDLQQLDDRFFFESSMLAEMSLARAVCVDVAIPARYGLRSSTRATSFGGSGCATSCSTSRRSRYCSRSASRWRRSASCSACRTGSTRPFTAFPQRQVP